MKVTRVNDRRLHINYRIGLIVELIDEPDTLDQIETVLENCIDDVERHEWVNNALKFNITGKPDKIRRIK